MKLDRPIYININALTIIKIILIFVLFYFLFLVRDILVALFISLILSSAIDPWVDYLQKKKIPRALGVLLIYLSFLLVVILAVSLIIPPIAEQVQELIINFPSILEKIISGVSALKEYSNQYGLLDNIKESVRAISSNLQGAAGGVFSTVSGILGGIFGLFLVLVITFYMSVEENAIKKIVWSVVPESHQLHAMSLINKMQRMIGLWLRGQLILSLIIFALTYVGLIALGLFLGQKIEYALVLALIAGLTEFVPYLGPVFAALPAVFLAFTQSPLLAVSVAILYYVIQLIENNLIVPSLMKKVVGLNPVVSIAVLLIGFKLAGVAGAILSIPVATAISVVVQDLFAQKAERESRNK
jgi:predicted PurR-regulated permease PerM